MKWRSPGGLSPSFRKGTGLSFLSILGLSQPLLSSPRPPVGSLAQLAVFLLPGSEFRPPQGMALGSHLLCSVQRNEIEEMWAGCLVLNPRYDCPPPASIYTPVSSASEEDGPQGIEECDEEPSWKPQRFAKKISPLHFFKPLGRIIFIFVTALKKHSRKETKAKEDRGQG